MGIRTGKNIVRKRDSSASSASVLGSRNIFLPLLSILRPLLRSASASGHSRKVLALALSESLGRFRAHAQAKGIGLFGLIVLFRELERGSPGLVIKRDNLPDTMALHVLEHIELVITEICVADPQADESAIVAVFWVLCVAAAGAFDDGDNQIGAAREEVDNPLGVHDPGAERIGRVRSDAVLAVANGGFVKGTLTVEILCFHDEGVVEGGDTAAMRDGEDVLFR
ncbi:unnamed protein product [Chondrus crispus]|uniref:Uncharacterized protein n=1 Tax=Chondrus crispus TaxID=2769 RepID=R7QAL2_CHOCR|nr:unnamed protein product [Chondrus crispus]CDF35542.1 unnamed protein product [Chondrus crispus]|eukprot:XP_005715361.1 unnamed protein product [Chondrus crispus]